MKEMTIDGHPVPTLVYGTAWKEERTTELVLQAVRAGFRGIDTANQRKHYCEAAVGDALQVLYNEGHQREDLFLQTKYTFIDGQDHRLPYDPKASYTTQVQQSCAKSLLHLKTNYLDSYVLHGPSTRDGLADADWESWKAMEEIYQAHKVRFLGVSNVTFEQLQALVEGAEIKPKFVQNRCYASTIWDQKIRQLCQDHDMIYQGFSLLTANRQELSSDIIKDMARHHQRTIPQVIFRFALQVGMQPLTGTTNEKHMFQDLDSYSFELSDAEVETIENITSKI